MRRLPTTSLLIALLLTGTLTPTAAQEDARWITHVVQAEENLFRIALQYGLSVDAVMAANGLMDPDLVVVGQQLLIPLSGDPAAVTTASPATPAAPVRTTVLGGTVMHTVAAGETLTRIAAQYEVTLNALLASNSLTAETPILTGQVLVLPVQSADLGLIGVDPITLPVESRPAPANDLAQPDLGLIGVEDVPVRDNPPDSAQASAADAVPDPVSNAVPNADQSPEGESAAPASDPPVARTNSAGCYGPFCLSGEPPAGQGELCGTCDTQREHFKTAMAAAAAAVAARDTVREDDTSESTGAVPQQQPRSDDLGILAADDAGRVVNAGDADNATAAPVASGAANAEQDIAPDATTDMPPAQAAAASAQSDLGILTQETAQLIDSGVIALNNDRLRSIYLFGLSQGNDPHAFSTIGDCNSEAPYFLAKFDRGEYDLGPYAHLQPVIDHFAGSFDRDSVAVWTGNHVWALFDATWSNPALCQPGEIPLACEFRIQKPSIALIRLGTNEAGSAALFEEHLRRVITFSLEHGTIPVLGTKADRLEGSDAMNTIIRQLAAEYAVPLWDFSAAVEQVPARGLMPDGFHMTYFPPDYSQPLALQSGHGMQNLTALLALDTVWREVKR